MLSPSVLIADAIVCCLLGAAIGDSKGQRDLGLMLGLLLGPIGILICVVMKPTIEVEAARAEAVEAERRRLRGETDPAPEPDTERPAT